MTMCSVISILMSSLYLSVMLCNLDICFSLSFGSEQNEAKHDSSSSPGVTDQEKEIAASAYEAYLVSLPFLTYFEIHYIYFGYSLQSHCVTFQNCSAVSTKCTCNTYRKTVSNKHRVHLSPYINSHISDFWRM